MIAWLQAIAALAPLLLKLFDAIVKDDKEKLEDALAQMPVRARQIMDENKRANEKKSPAELNRRLNGDK